MANPWFKFYAGEYLSDLKILQLNGNERSCWLTLLCLANQGEDGVVKFLSESQLLILSGITEPMNDILKKFQELGMIQISNGIVTITNWEKRQYSEGYSRVKQFRKRKSNEKDNDRIEKNRTDKNREEKSTYGIFQNVKLSDEEHKNLVEKLGEVNTKVLIVELDSYIESLGKDKYKNHYATILNWARRKFTEHQEKKSLQIKKRTIA